MYLDSVVDPEDVFKLDVAMDDLLLMQEVDSFRNHFENTPKLALFDEAVPLLLALHELHRIQHLLAAGSLSQSTPSRSGDSQST